MATKEKATKEKAKKSKSVDGAEAYCVKCKKTRKMVNAKSVVTKNKRNAVKGECSKCETKMFKFVS